VLGVGDRLGSHDYSVLAGGGRGKVAEQGWTHGGITGGAAFCGVLVDRDEERHCVGLSERGHLVDARKDGSSSQGG
jgi:hypothetical protein